MIEKKNKNTHEKKTQSKRTKWFYKQMPDSIVLIWL